MEGKVREGQHHAYGCHRGGKGWGVVGVRECGGRVVGGAGGNGVWWAGDEVVKGREIK